MARLCVSPAVSVKRGFGRRLSGTPKKTNTTNASKSSSSTNNGEHVKNATNTKNKG